MDQCLNDLDDAREYKTDQLVVQLVRIQRLTERIFHFHSSNSPVDEQLGSPEPSTMARLETFRVELDRLRDALPPHLKSDCMIPHMYENAFANPVREPRLSILLLQYCLPPALRTSTGRLTPTRCRISILRLALAFRRADIRYLLTLHCRTQGVGRELACHPGLLLLLHAAARLRPIGPWRHDALSMGTSSRAQRGQALQCQLGRLAETSDDSRATNACSQRRAFMS